MWQIGVLAAILGVNNAFENPSRQSFMLELVGPEHLRNAVSLNSVLVNVARAIGPAVAGILIATVGDGVCFLVNAASFVAVVASLALMDCAGAPPDQADPAAPRGSCARASDTSGPSASSLLPLLMMAAVGCLTYEFQVSLPVMASRGLHVGPAGFGFMTAAMGVGAVLGGLVVAHRGKTGLRPLVMAAWVFGIAVGLAALAPNLARRARRRSRSRAAASISFMATGNSTLQLNAEESMRGRVMSLWFVALPGLDADRRPDRRCRDGGARRPGRARARRRDVPRGRGRGHARAAAPPTRPSALHTPLLEE